MLSLHGAMTTESLEDQEGDLVSAVREVVGPDVPIVVSLDLHGHITDLMVNPSDAIIGFHTHPHVDFFDTGLRAMRIRARALRGEVKPVVVQRELKMITSAETHNTSSGPMIEIMRRVIEMEKEPGILAATVRPLHDPAPHHPGTDAGRGEQGTGHLPIRGGPSASPGQLPRLRSPGLPRRGERAHPRCP